MTAYEINKPDGEEIAKCTMHMKWMCTHQSVVCKKKEWQDVLCAVCTGIVWSHLYVGRMMENAFNVFGMLGCLKHLFTTVHILQYRVPLWSRHREREREREMSTEHRAEKERGCKKIQFWRKPVKFTPEQMEILFALCQFVVLLHLRTCSYFLMIEIGCLPIVCIVSFTFSLESERALCKILTL